MLKKGPIIRTKKKQEARNNRLRSDWNLLPGDFPRGVFRPYAVILNWIQDLIVIKGCETLNHKKGVIACYKNCQVIRGPG